MEYTISRIRPDDSSSLAQVDALLEQEGIRRDANLDYIVSVYDRQHDMVATGACFENTLRCLAVSRKHRGEGLLSRLITHLTEVQFERGHSHIFIYTKADTSGFFEDLGFYEIVCPDGKLVFLENKRDGFSRYLGNLEKNRTPGRAGAVVMNANPFTLGHQHLIETAASECDMLHVFVLSEDASIFPFSVRKKLVKEGISHLKNVMIHDSGPYIISSATFPSYFLKDSEDVIQSHARLDAEIFKKISSSLGISARYAGEEPASLVTGLYNEIMAFELPKEGIEFNVIPRITEGGRVISASFIRMMIKVGDMDAVSRQVPGCTLEWLKSSEAVQLIERIKREKSVIHY